jgi:hypothetical protein
MMKSEWRRKVEKQWRFLENIGEEMPKMVAPNLTLVLEKHKNVTLSVLAWGVGRMSWNHFLQFEDNDQVNDLVKTIKFN